MVFNLLGTSYSKVRNWCSRIISLSRDGYNGFVDGLHSRSHDAGRYIEDTFDTLIYYVMNGCMLIFLMWEVVLESFENVMKAVNLVNSGYKNGFIGNIN